MCKFHSVWPPVNLHSQDSVQQSKLKDRQTQKTSQNTTQTTTAEKHNLSKQSNVKDAALVMLHYFLKTKSKLNESDQRSATSSNIHHIIHNKKDTITEKQTLQLLECVKINTTKLVHRSANHSCCHFDTMQHKT